MSKRLLMTLDELRRNRRQILQVAHRYGASNVRVFGSVARGAAGDQSDIDFLVDPSPEFSLLDHVGLIQDLQELLGLEVDVVSAKSLQPLLRDRILDEAIIL